MATPQYPSLALKGEINEVTTCFAHGAWKAAYILAGSIAEQALFDYLLRHPPWNKLSRKPGCVIVLCKDHPRLTKLEGEITQLLDRCHNLVDPQLALRADWSPSRDDAAAAIVILQQVIAIVADEDTASSALLNAEDIARVVIGFDSDLIRVHQLMVRANRAELRRLLLEVIPARIAECLGAAGTAWEHTLLRLRDGFDLGFCLAEDSCKKAVLDNFTAGIDRHEMCQSVLETVLFRPKYLSYVGPGDRQRMLHHILERLQNERSLAVLRMADGIEEFLFDDDDVLAWLRTVVIACLAAPADAAAEIHRYAQRAYARLQPEQKLIVARKQEEVLRDCECEGNYGLACLLRHLHEEWTNAIAESARMG